MSSDRALLDEIAEQGGVECDGRREIRLEWSACELVVDRQSDEARSGSDYHGGEILHGVVERALLPARRSRTGELPGGAWVAEQLLA